MKLLCAAAQQQTMREKERQGVGRERNLQEETREGEKQRSRWKTKQPTSVGERRGLFWRKRGSCCQAAVLA
jgi:hypothetical protein